MPDKIRIWPVGGRDGRDEEAERWEAQLRKGCLEMAVLAALAPGRNYGLEIIRALEEHSNLAISEGTVYPILNRLRQEGLVDAVWVESDSGHPRKYYTLTRKGRERATRMAEVWVEFSAGLSSLIAPLVQARKERPVR